MHAPTSDFGTGGRLLAIERFFIEYWNGRTLSFCETFDGNFVEGARHL
jgi:hypothetical protein